MPGTIDFHFDDSRPLLPQMEGFITHHKRLGCLLEEVYLLPENYLKILREMKIKHKMPKAPKGKHTLINNILGVKIYMAMPGGEENNGTTPPSPETRNPKQ